MSSEHVEVLRNLSEVCRAAIKAGDWKVDGACDPDSLLRHADAAIAALSAPQPPAEAQPVYVGVDLEGGWIRATTPPSAPVGVDGVKCPWDGGSPCVEPRPIGMVYPMKPAPRASGYLDGSGVEWNAWDAEQMEAYARAAYSDGWEAGYRSALAQQPAAVDGAMVERIAALLHEEATDEPWSVAGVEHDGPDRDYYRTLARRVIDRAGQQPAAVDGVRERLVECRDWFDQQAETISKGGGSTWDLLQCREQRDLCDAALSGQQGGES